MNPGRTASTDDAEASLGFSATAAPGADGGTAVTIFGELDMGSAPELRELLEGALDAGGEIELDMRACSFVDSTGIATLVTIARKLAERERVLKLKGARDRVCRILDLAGLTQQGWIELEDC